MTDTVEQRATRILSVALVSKTVPVAIELEQVAAELLAPVKPAGSRPTAAGG